MAGETDAQIQDEIVQVNVRLRRQRVEVARRIAASRGETMTAYLDRLVAEDMERERETLTKQFELEEQALRVAKAAMLKELEESQR